MIMSGATLFLATFYDFRVIGGITKIIFYILDIICANNSAVWFKGVMFILVFLSKICYQSTKTF
ncbi:hypothetical protein GLOIN_2v1653664 [Rhizophagus irregularis DAOM 181602=DAOM 197198]|uniref:Uncharacterized protein n=1 Tax=Rhizophagus irregularis (strain DAOM 181602 / DAOM 197198 / MUCL 43194) TaxID=747089 RepID=A0A2P4PNB4_RHIID|nr:hypothetical protein GLOIN_2v1653664 [Rhizophagus irregularis DAOM 181602=DAOM 197198]POG66876.1 hypothetical protein GLOIN_2v1653664 [Rhizophagus irregularis DAOM 181602=DAOM 197198]|eukprot:XP_025173742.1 hypothetical protein GLOIN_2v1653664 [Rhizophagus irregularis DAOM 181602=DAOM 197198]